MSSSSLTIIRLSITSSFVILFTFHLLLLSTPSSQSETAGDDVSIDKGLFSKEEIADFAIKATCFQKRKRTAEQTKKLKAICGDSIVDNFCEHVNCQPLTSCPPGQTLTERVFGHGCCPACVEFKPDGAPCKQSSLKEQCANGLFCDPSKGVCAVPAVQKACLADYHNRMLFKSKAPQSGFWVPADVGPLVLKIDYKEDMQLPACSRDGDYQTKQLFKNKAYCVSPDTGSPTFGVADFGKASETTCKCSTAMYNVLNRIDPAISEEARERALDEQDIRMTNHFADTHIKCSSTGDFHEMQCVNETCFCVNQFTGVPLTTVDDWDEYQEKLDATSDERNGGIYYISPDGKVVKDPKNLVNERKMTDEEVKKYEEEEDKKKEEERKKRGPRVPTNEVNSSATTIFGAFRPLVCFDYKRAKEVNSNFSNEVYAEECQKLIHIPMTMQRHFTLKGSNVKGLEAKSCGYDDKFSRKQCLPEACLCSNPKGHSIGSYSTPLVNAQAVECRCALEEYLVKVERQAFDVLKCDGAGDFSALQCIGDRACYCADSNGAAISQQFSFKKVNDFIKKHAPGHSMDLVCGAMRGSVTNDRVWPENYEIWYNNSMKWYDAKPISEKRIPLLNNVVLAA